MSTFTGTAGNDSIVGTDAGDDFHLEQGGSDTTDGGGGVDIFYMGGAFDASDQIDGGGGSDFLMLDGDYSAGVKLTSTTLRNVEHIAFAAGNDYVISGLTDANLSGQLFVDGSALGAGDRLSFDASQITQAISISGGGGNDVLRSGSGADTVVSGGGHDKIFSGAGIDQITLSDQHANVHAGDGDDTITANGAFAGDKIDGGAGNDTLTLMNVHGTFDFRDSNLTGVEHINIYGPSSVSIILADGNVAAGGYLTVYGVYAEGPLLIDGSHETDGVLDLYGDNHSTLIGGAGGDYLQLDGIGSGFDGTMIGGAGADTLQAGDGDDKFVGGAGADDLQTFGQGHDSFFFLDVSDSTPDAPDLIEGFDKTDTLYLKPIDANAKHAGNQAFHLVDAFTGKAGELTVNYDSARHLTNIQGDVNGDGQADLLIQMQGDHTGLIDFVL